LTFLLAAAILLFLIVGRTAHAPGPTGDAAQRAEAERLKSLAADLEKRTLYAEAERAWGEYAALASLSSEEKAELSYRRGKCLKEDGRYAEAGRRLSEVETFSPPRELKRKAWQLLLECFAALGKKEVYESLSRAFAMQGETEKGTVVARVEGDTITKEELRSELAEDAERFFKLQGMPLTSAEISRKAQEMVEAELKSPEAAKQALQRSISAQVLYREGVQRGFGEDKETGEAVLRFRRGFVANRVIESELETAMKNVGPTDLQNHYEAHKDRFLEKAGSEFSFARFGTRGEAEAAVQKLRQADSAKEVRLEKAKGVAALGEPVPGIGPSAEITAHLLALGDGETSDRPLEHERAFYVFRVEKKRPERQLSFEEAEPKVRADLAQVKRKEALEALQTSLSQKFHVEIVDPNLSTAPQGGAPASAEKPAEKDAGKNAANEKKKDGTVKS
jgi:peptidyl-prolyl cis-trans isomerase C